MKINELIIAGAGPVDMTAGIYAARKRMDFIIVSREPSDQITFLSKAKIPINPDNDISYQSRTVIIADGSIPRLLSVKGAKAAMAAFE